MKTYLLPENLRKALMDYLLTRPLGEVYDGYNALASLEELPETPPAEENDP